MKWAYRYEYPNDCLAIRYLFPPIGAGSSPESFRRSLLENPTPYELALDDDDSETICTDLSSVAMEYTKRVMNPARFDATFSSTLSWALSAEVALPLAKTVDHAKNAAVMYEKTLSEAIAKALNEEVQGEPPESQFVLARL